MINIIDTKTYNYTNYHNTCIWFDKISGEGMDQQ